MGKTTTIHAAEALEGLRPDDWQKFLFVLRDRRAEPRIRRREVEGKNSLEVTSLMVSRFTEAGALEVTLDILREIRCNQEAETLESKTKAPLGAAQQGGSTWKNPDEVEAEAEARVRSEGGDPHNERLVLSRYVLQVGEYKGRDFQWLLENKLSYVVTLVANHQMEKQEHNAIPEALKANKDSLTKYVMAYPEVENLVRSQIEKERSGQNGTALVGFGKYRTETLQDLYESEDDSKISYVDFLRKKKKNCTSGSKMEAAVKYILQRDRAMRRTPRKRVRRTRSQRTRSQSASSSRYADSGSAAGRGRPLTRTQRDRPPRL